MEITLVVGKHYVVDTGSGGRKLFVVDRLVPWVTLPSGVGFFDWSFIPIPGGPEPQRLHVRLRWLRATTKKWTGAQWEWKENLQRRNLREPSGTDGDLLSKARVAISAVGERS